MSLRPRSADERRRELQEVEDFAASWVIATIVRYRVRFLVLPLSLLVAVVFPGLFTGRDPLASDMSQALEAPSFEHIFGTDHLGRDVWARVVHGARYSILIGVASTVLAVLLGVLLGLIAGVSHRRVGEAISRVFDAVGAFPDLLFALMLIALIGPGTGNVIAAIAIASAPRYGRVVRAETLRVRESDYVIQSRLAIASATRRTSFSVRLRYRIRAAMEIM